MTEVILYEAEQNWCGKSSQLQSNLSLARCEKAYLTSPLEYKYHVIFVLVLDVIYTL